MKNMWKQKKDYFWIRNKFIREYAKDLSVHAQIVYVVLCCHADDQHKTFIGYRRIATFLNINKNTVMYAENELEAYGLIRRLDHKPGLPYRIEIFTVRYIGNQPSIQNIHKEYNKEFNKEEVIKSHNTGKERMFEILKTTHPEFYNQLRPCKALMKRSETAMVIYNNN